MRKIIFFIVVLAGIFAFYEQTKPNPNVWISAFCIMLFMIGLLILNKKVNDNQNNDLNVEEDLDRDVDIMTDENQNDDKQGR